MLQLIVIINLFLTGFGTTAIPNSIKKINSNILTYNEDIEYWGVIAVALDETLAPHIYNGLSIAENWDENHIRVLWKENATREAIIESINWLSENVDENDIALFSFDGHGSYINKKYGIFPWDGGDITIEELDYIIDQISALGLVLIFDCCFSGTFITFDNMNRLENNDIYKKYEDSIKENLAGDNRVILMSTMKYGLGSHWIDINPFTGEKTDICFSSKLAEAWTNIIDENNDNICSAEESFNYAKKKLFRYSLITASRLLLQIGAYLAYGHFYLPFPTIYDSYEGELPIIEKSNNLYKKEYCLNPFYSKEKKYLSVDSTFLEPNDPLFMYQWSLENTGQFGIEDVDIDASDAWEITTGDVDITIAIIDSGIDFSHPDLIDNIWINIDEIGGNGLDDDSNGYIDDVNGYDFTNTDNDNIPYDRNGHGTLLAGRVAPVTNNHIGVAGITWNCKIMSLQVIDNSGKASVKDIIEAMHYAIDNGAKIICMTFEGTTFDQELQEAINYASKKGVFVCSAAGNSGTSSKRYPAAYENVTSVAAINQFNSRMEYTYEEVGISIASNYGSWVDVAAPGQEIYSTMPTYHVPLNDAYKLDEEYTVATGCCVTAPLVAGVAALILSKDPTLSPNELSFIIRASTKPIESTYYLGTGCINAYNALVYDNRPEKPTGPTTGKIREEYTYSTSIQYANNESLYYLWDFGDGKQSNWIGPIQSNEPCKVTYSWNQKGNYNIKIKVKDESGGESRWSDPLVINMSKNKFYIYSLFHWFFEQHPRLFPLLRHLLRL